MATQTSDVRSGTYAAEGNVTAAGAYAKKTLSGTYPDAYARVGFEIERPRAPQVTLLRLRDAVGAGNFGYVYLTAGLKLAFHNDLTTVNTLSATSPSAGWHALELHLGVNGASSTVDVWLDGAAVADLSATGVTLGTAPVGQLQIGDTSNLTCRPLAPTMRPSGPLASGRLPDAAPTVPANLAATTPSPYSVSLTWSASKRRTLGVVGYDLFRDGSPYQSLVTMS